MAFFYTSLAKQMTTNKVNEVRLYTLFLGMVRRTSRNSNKIITNITFKKKEKVILFKNDVRIKERRKEEIKEKWKGGKKKEI